MPTSTPERPLVHGCVSLIRSRSEIVKLHGLVGRTLWAPFVRPFSCTELEKNKQLNCKLSRSLCTNVVTALLSTELVGWSYCGKPPPNPEEQWKIDAPDLVVVANKNSARPKSSKIKGIKGEMTILMGGRWIFLFCVTTCACRCRSAGYLWLIIAVGPVALTIDLIKADKMWLFQRTTHASQ